MPLKLPTRCRHAGCLRLVRSGRFCDAHRGDDGRVSDARRPTPAERGYDAAWANVARLRRRFDAYLCQECLKVGQLTSSKTVDHIIPVHVRPDWRLELGNTQVICVPCHRSKTADDTERYGSSTQRILSVEQRESRRRAQELIEPTRSDT